MSLHVFSRLQRGKRHTVENGSGAEDNGDSSHCSNASVHSNQVTRSETQPYLNEHFNMFIWFLFLFILGGIHKSLV